MARIGQGDVGDIRLQQVGQSPGLHAAGPIDCQHHPAPSIESLTIGHDEPLPPQAIQVGHVGGGEHVHRRAVLNLMDQVSGGTEAKRYWLSGLLREQPADFGERELQIGGGGYHQRVVCGRSCWADQVVTGD